MKRAYFSEQKLAPQIMNHVNYPYFIFSHVLQESICLGKIMNNLDFSRLIEIGCFDGRYMEFSSIYGIDYLGIDINSIGQKLFKQKSVLRNHKEHKAIFALMDVENYKWLSYADRHSIIVLPFNFLGIVRNIETFLVRSVQNNSSLYVSLFENSTQTELSRLQYYTKCSVDNIMIKKNNFGGKHFYNYRGFSSHSFSMPSLRKLISALDMEIIFEMHGYIGLFLLIKNKIKSIDSI